MADALTRLLRLDENSVDEPPPPPPPQPRRNRNTRDRAPPPRRNAPSHDSPPQSFNNSGTQNMKGLINNTGYVQGNGNGSIIFGGFDSTTKTYY